MNFSSKKLKNYLLGDLSETETDQIELQIISGEISEENLLIAENDLHEDYLEKSLSPAKLELFHKNFLVSEERNRQLSEIQALKNYARNKKSAQTFVRRKSDENHGFFRRIAFAPSFLPLRAVFALVIIGVFVWIFAVIFVIKPADGNFSALEQEYAKINQEDLTDIDKFKDVSNINLTTGTFRGADKTNNLTRQNLTGKVLVRLALPDGVNPAKGFNISFLNDGKSVFTQTVSRVYQNPHGVEIRLFVPSEVLQKGVYQINVKNPAEENALLKYGFSVD